jgi:phosphoribosyl 1,2-cyclic phosphodiesterase
LKFCVLASSSSGNSAFLSSGRTRLLIDAGLSKRETAKRLAGIGESLDTLDGILITHEHSDHVAGLGPLSKQIPVYVSHLTAPHIEWGPAGPHLELFQTGSSFSIGDIDVTSFTIPHDAVDPAGFTFRVNGVRVGIATDLGYVPDSIKYHLRGSDLLLLESNHDLEMLKVGPYPWAVKQRVMGRKGHLSNEVVSDFIRQDLDTSTSTLILGHLSENNNHPEIVRLVASQALEGRALFTKLVVAEPGQCSEVFEY